MGDLPKGWAQVAFKDVVEVNPRRTFDLEPDDMVTFVPMAAVSEISGAIVDDVSRPLRDVTKGFTQFSEGDVIFAKITPSMENGKSAIATGLVNGIGFGSTEFHVLRSYGGVIPEYIWYFIRQKSFRDDARKVMTGAVGQQRVPAAYLKEHLLPLPPLTEQKRIVAKLDNLTSRTANARTAINHISPLIEKYKQAILRKAFSGDLTAGWRSCNGVSMSRTVRLGDVVSDIRYGTAKKSYPEKRGTAVLRIPNVSDGHINLVDLKYTNFDDQELRKLALQLGDILVVRSNGSPDLVGRVAMVTEAEAGLAYAGYLIRLRPNINKIKPEYLKYILGSPQIRNTIKAIIRSSNGIHNINSGELSSLEFPCPELDEQSEIVRRIETGFVWLNRVSNEHAAASDLLSALDPSLLQVAFQGELVPQNPHDEPASILLERVKAERDTLQQKTKSGRETAARPQKPTKSGVRMTNLIEVLKSSENWVSASKAAQALGIGNGATSDAVEEFYNELRAHLQGGLIEVERRGDEDWLRLMPISGV